MYILTTTALASINLSSLQGIIYLLIFIVNVASVLILCLGVTKALLTFLSRTIQAIIKHEKINDISENNDIKRHLGSYILLSLEILIAADIIKSILEPSIDDILILGAIVVIRTIISYFLAKETAEITA
jgi:uncharacterized membrane protein